MRQRVLIAIALLSAVLLVGTLGYVLIEHWRLLDAVYMTVITIGTVGFREVHPLSDAGRVFTIALILLGVGAIGFAFATIVDFLVEGHLRGYLEERRMDKLLASLSHHHIVAGMGRVGSEVARSFSAEGVPFVVIDNCMDCVERATASGWPVLAADATEENALRAAGIDRAASLVTTLDSDASNVFVTLTARTLNPGIFIVARSTTSTTEEQLKRAGADRVITPSVIGGRRMASMVLHPYVSEYVDLADAGRGEVRLEEVELPEGSALVGRSLQDARITERTGVLVLAMRSRDGRVAATPASDTMLQAGARLVVMGAVGQLEKLAAFLNGSS
ncbi:MAG TPA: potassium channel protein [Coriobacteriia bacterium]|jgi:voltage-gated potassium channel